MKTVSMHEAKTHLSRLVKQEFVITKNGEPVARVTPLGSRGGPRFGFLPAEVAREVQIPADFDTMGSAEFAAIIDQRIAEADANPNDYVTLDEDEREVRSRTP